MDGIAASYRFGYRERVRERERERERGRRWSQVGQTGKFAQSFRYNPSIKEKKVFKLGCAEADAGGGGITLSAFFTVGTTQTLTSS